jgi:hypothetical protein
MHTERVVSATEKGLKRMKSQPILIQSRIVNSSSSSSASLSRPITRYAPGKSCCGRSYCPSKYEEHFPPEHVKVGAVDYVDI